MTPQDTPLGDECNCEFDPYEPQYPGYVPGEESWHFKRTCGGCSNVWWSLHCVHDGAQNPCPNCGWILEGRKTPMEIMFGAFND